MSDPTRPYEPLTSESALLILIDHQVGLMTGVRDYSIGELKHNVVGLAKAAKALKLPIIVTTTARDSMWGPTFPELVEALPGVPIIDRSSVNAFDDPKVAQAITATDRKKLIFAGISLEVCAAFPAITAVGKGLDAYVAVDASGTFSETKRQVGLLRMLLRVSGHALAEVTRCPLMTQSGHDQACATTNERPSIPHSNKMLAGGRGKAQSRTGVAALHPTCLINFERNPL